MQESLTKQLSGAFLVLTLVFGASCGNADAHYSYGRGKMYTPEERAKQKRANMAERTHQIKERQEFARLNRERAQISEANCIREYPANVSAKGKRSHSPARLAHLERGATRQHTKRATSL